METGSDRSSSSLLPEQRAVPIEVIQERAQDQCYSVRQQKMSTVTRQQQANEEYEDVFPPHNEEKQIGVHRRIRTAGVHGGHFEVQAIVHSEDWTHAGQHSGRGQKILHTQAVKKHADQQTVTSQQTGHVNTYIKPRISHLCPSPTIDQEVRGITQEDLCICHGTRQHDIFRRDTTPEFMEGDRVNVPKGYSCNLAIPKAASDDVVYRDVKVANRYQSSVISEPVNRRSISTAYPQLIRHSGSTNAARPTDYQHSEFETAQDDSQSVTSRHSRRSIRNSVGTRSQHTEDEDGDGSQDHVAAATQHRHRRHFEEVEDEDGDTSQDRVAAATAHQRRRRRHHGGVEDEDSDGSQDQVAAATCHRRRLRRHEETEDEDGDEVDAVRTRKFSHRTNVRRSHTIHHQDTVDHDGRKKTQDLDRKTRTSCRVQAKQTRIKDTSCFSDSGSDTACGQKKKKSVSSREKNVNLTGSVKDANRTKKNSSSEQTKSRKTDDDTCGRKKHPTKQSSKKLSKGKHHSASGGDPGDGSDPSSRRQ